MSYKDTIETDETAAADEITEVDEEATVAPFETAEQSVEGVVAEDHTDEAEDDEHPDTESTDGSRDENTDGVAEQPKKKMSTALFAGIALLVMIAIIAVVFALSSGNDDEKSNNPSESSQTDGTNNTGSNANNGSDTSTVKQDADADYQVGYAHIFSNGLTEDGKIEGVVVADYVKLCDVTNVVISKKDIEATEEEINEEISAILSSYDETVDKSTEQVVQNGDKLHIDYVGYIDGEAFSGGNTEGQGAELTIGSHQYIDTFEEQLIGHHVGETVEVNVTFPDPYPNNTAYSGKQAKFVVVINGVFKTSEFNDEFVQTYLSEYASSADELKAFIAELISADKKSELISAYLFDGSEVTGYPEEYLAKQVEVQKFNQELRYEYMRNMYAQYGMTFPANSILEFYGITEEEYNEQLEKNAKDMVAQCIIVQAAFEKLGMVVTEENISEFINAAGYDSDEADMYIEVYGKPFIIQLTMADMVCTELERRAVISE